MRIIVIGAEGDIGRAVCAELGERHEIIRVGRSKGDIRADMTDAASVAAMYRSAGRVDAVVSAAGSVPFEPLTRMTPEQMLSGLRGKALAQIGLVLAGLDQVADGGSFTLTSGVLNRDPIRTGAAAAAANGALDGFVRSAAIEMPRGLRINAVSPGVLDVSLPRYGRWFPGHEPVAAARVGRAFAKSVEGAITGQVIVLA